MLAKWTVAALAAVLLTAGMAAGPSSGARPAPLVAQQQEESSPAPVVLAPGERFSLDGAWDLEVQDFFLHVSHERERYRDVEVAVGFRNTSAAPVVFSRAGLADTPDLYPQLQLRDAAGVVHQLRLAKPKLFSVPSSNLTQVLPGTTAHWTVGFEVPEVYDHALVAEAVWQGQVVAAWDLFEEQEPLAGWAAPEGVEAGELGEALEWGEQLEVTPTSHGVRLCGDPDTQHAVVVAGLGFSVENHSFTDALWPGTRYPESPGVAIWSDGASARLASETFTGDEELLDRRSFEAVVIPPAADPSGEGTVASPEPRAMIFVTSRDGRFGEVGTTPQAVLLTPPGGDPIWLPLTDSPTLGVDSGFCDAYEGMSYQQVFPLP